jgi:glycosyltransferase involved in cell wall biosynthesis
MPGAWEARPPLILLGIPNTNIVTINWALAFRSTWLPPGTDVRGWSGLPIDVSRNACVKNARDAKAKYLLFLDSDVVCDRTDWVRCLMDLQQPIVSGLYWSKKGHPGMWKLDGEDYLPITEWPRGSMIEVDAVGAGALLIETRVFDVLDKLGLKPYFKWEIDDPSNIGHNKSEDFHFCKLAKQAGFNIMVDTAIEMHHEQNVAWDIHGQATKLND